MISFEALAHQAYLAFQAEFLRNTDQKPVAWEEMPGALKAAWIAAARQMHTSLSAVH